MSGLWHRLMHWAYPNLLLGKACLCQKNSARSGLERQRGEGVSATTTEPTNRRAWELLQQTLADDETTTSEWIVQMHNEVHDLIERLYEYGRSPTPSQWVRVDEVAVSVADLLAGTMR